MSREDDDDANDVDLLPASVRDFVLAEAPRKGVPFEGIAAAVFAGMTRSEIIAATPRDLSARFAQRPPWGKS